MPFTPEEVAKFMEASTTQIKDRVPRIIQLVPIPESIKGVSKLIHKIEDAPLQDLLKNFAQLDDIRVRFVALRGRGAGYRKLAPLLATAADIAVTKFHAAHAELLLRLRDCITSLKSSFSVKHISSSLMDEAEACYRRHSTLLDYQPPEYPHGLHTLEETFTSFEDLLKAVTMEGDHFVLPKDALLAINSGNVLPLIFLPALRPTYTRDCLTNITFVTSQVSAFPAGTPFQVLYIEDSHRLDSFLPNTLPSLEGLEPTALRRRGEGRSVGFGVMGILRFKR